MKHARTPCPQCAECALWESRYGLARCAADKPVMLVDSLKRECTSFEGVQDGHASLAENKRLVDGLPNLGQAAAQAEAEYRQAKAKKELELRGEGYPATLIPDLAKGDEEVSLLGFARDCAKVEFDSQKEAIMFRKREADMPREQIAREWGRP